MPLQPLQRLHRFVATWDLFDKNRRSPHHRGRQDERVVGYLGRVDDLDRMCLLDGVLDHEPANIRVTAAARPKERGATAQVDQVLTFKLHWFISRSPTALTRILVALDGR